MASNLILTKRGNSLVAEDVATLEIMQRIEEGKRVRAVVTVPRNLKHHNLLFALLNTVWKAQPEPRRFPTQYSLLDALKMATGHVREVMDLQGKIHYVPASIDFASMDQVKFSEWFDAAITVILERVLLNVGREALETEIYHMLGERGPNDF